MKRFIAAVLMVLIAGMVHAAPQVSRATSAALPAATSTSGTRPRSTIASPSAQQATPADQTAYYGSPYYCDDSWFGGCGLHADLDGAIQGWWAAYKQYWGVNDSNCSYYYTLTGSGGAKKAFVLMYIHGSACGGGPSGIYGTAYSYTPGKNNGCSNQCQAGDPINLGTGNEYEDQEDYSANGSLSFERHYNSNNSVASTHIGMRWRDNFDRSIEYLTDGTNSTATVYRADGKTVGFEKVNGVWTPDPDINDTLLENDDAQGQLQSWTFFDAAAQQFENYNSSGELTSIQDLSGQITTLAYSDGTTPTSVAPAPGLLITVTGPRGRQLQFVYDASSRITQITLPDGGTLGYSYDTSGNLTQVTYPDGRTRAYKYDESGWAPSGFSHALTGIIDENGNRYADVHYDSQGRATSSQLGGVSDLTQVAYNSDGTATVTYPLGVQTTIGFAVPYGRMQVSSASQPCAPSCNQTAASRTYDANGNPASSVDFKGVTTAYTYDANGLETQRIEAQGTPVQRTINTTWDTVLRNPLDRTVLDSGSTLTAKTDWIYNVRGQVIARCEDDPTISGATSYVCSTSGTPPAGVRRWTYTYCDAVGSQCPLIGLLLSVDGPRTDVADVTQYTYYAATNESGCGQQGGTCHRAGDLSQIINAFGRITRFASYDKDGRVTESVDPNGTPTYFTYTPRGWLRTRSVGSAKTIIAYDAVGNVTKVTQPDGVFTTYAYDAAHRLISIGDALGNHVDFTLDAAGNRIAEKTYAEGSATPARSLSRVYNNLGELVQSLDALGHAASYTYDSDGNRTSATDALGVVTHSSYDALNRLSQTVQNYLGNDPATANTTTSYAYDSRDNLSQVTDPDGLVTHYYHNGLDGLNQLLSPDTGTTHYTYDAAGNRVSRTDGRGVITTYAYNALNQLHSISYPTAALDVQFNYGKNNGVTGCPSSYYIGRMTQMIDATGSTNYCYDARDNVIEKIQFIGTTKYTTFYKYNSANRLMGITYPDGGKVTYTRDANGRIASVSATPVGGIATTVVSATTYLPFGPATAYSFADASQVLDKLYDANYRATDIEGSALNLHFKLDAMGDVIAEGNAAGVPTPNESYLYDPLYRLQQVDDATGAPWQTYTYDKTGDRLSKAMAGVGTDTYSYTSNTHHLIGISGYDTSNRAMDANGNTAALQANGWTYGLGYDNTNRLTVVQQNGTTIATYGLNGIGERATKTLAGGGTQAYVYDETGHLLGEYATGQSRDYVWADGALVAILDNPAQGGDTIHYVYTDNLGTPRAITTQAGTVIWDWPYNQNPFGEAPASGNGYTLNLRYPGQYYDQEDGLNYNHFRDYEPTTGRYIESDPIGLDGGISTYAYASSNPILLNDPTGRTVTMTCRPLSMLGAIGVNTIMHCSAIIWHYEKDPCTGELHKVITAQYSLPYGARQPTTNQSNQTYKDDRDAFNSPTSNDYNYDIAPPPGVSQSDFDNQVTQFGSTYSQGPYHLTGPNSNTAAADIIAGPGGTPPPVPGAVGEYYYLRPRFP